MSTPDPTPSTPQVPFWKREPVAVFGGVQSLLAAVLTVLFAFDIWEPTTEQITALSGLYTALSAFFILLVRGQVTPNGSVELTTEEADFIRTIQNPL